MKKIDLKKDFAALYKATAKPVAVKVPKLRYLMIDGQGDPNTSTAFADAITTLYGVAYTMKFMLKQGPEAIDYPKRRWRPQRWSWRARRRNYLPSVCCG